MPSPSPAVRVRSSRAPQRTSVQGEARTRILAAALDLFAERGFTATTTAEIARRAGVAEKTIFAIFRSKDALFDQTLDPATVDLFLPNLKHAPPTVFDERATLRDVLSRVVHSRIEVFRQHPTKFKLIVQEMVLKPERARRFLKTIQSDQAFNHQIEQAFRRFQERGELREMPMGQLHRLLASVIFGYAVTRLVIWPDRRWNDEAEIEATVDVLVNGLSARRVPAGRRG